MNIRLRGTETCSVEAFAASWIEIAIAIHISISRNVEAFAASWIEMNICLVYYGCKGVEAFAASWIEIRVSFQR